MEGSRSRDGRQIRRCHETSRFEDELWALAYDQISPSASRPMERSQPVRRPVPRVPASLRSPIARSA
jgi:hypothetical protein